MTTAATVQRLRGLMDRADKGTHKDIDRLIVALLGEAPVMLDMLTDAATIAQCLDDGDYGEANCQAALWLAKWNGEVDE